MRKSQAGMAVQQQQQQHARSRAACFLVLQGTWECSVKGSCEHVVRDDASISAIAALRALRVFRIFWIFKNFNVLSIGTVLGRLQVRGHHHHHRHDPSHPTHTLGHELISSMCCHPFEVLA